MSWLLLLLSHSGMSSLTTARNLLYNKDAPVEPYFIVTLRTCYKNKLLDGRPTCIYGTEGQTHSGLSFINF